MPPTKNKNNPANRQSQLFIALTRLLSGPIINYRSQTGRRANNLKRLFITHWTRSPQMRSRANVEMKDMWTSTRWNICLRLPPQWISMLTR